MRFANPWWFALLALVMLRMVWLIRDRRQGLSTFEFSSMSLVSQKTSLFSSLSWIPVVLEILGWICIVAALARPQRVTTYSADDRLGLDMVIVLDASGSMAAEDFRPRNRFAVAKELISDFIDRRESDRIGVVTFGSRAATRVPITFDREIAREILDTAQIGDNGDGTAIGLGIASAVNRLRSSKSRSRVILLLTDGVNNAGAIEPAAAAALAGRYGIKIYSVAVGSRGNVPMPIKVQNRFTGEIETYYQLVRADIDEVMLDAIARSTGGSYFRATDPGTLEGILARIDALEKTKLGAPRIRTVQELYVPPLTTAVTALFAAFLLGETVWLKLSA